MTEEQQQLYEELVQQICDTLNENYKNDNVSWSFKWNETEGRYQAYVNEEPQTAFLADSIVSLHEDHQIPQDKVVQMFVSVFGEALT